MVLVDIVKEHLEKAAEECRSHGQKVLAFEADAADGKKTREIVEQATKELGKIDILVYAAVPALPDMKKGLCVPSMRLLMKSGIGIRCDIKGFRLCG